MSESGGNGNEMLSIFGAIAGAIGVIVTGVLGFLSGSNKAKTDANTVAISGFNQLTDQLQEERGANSRRILELEGRMAQMEQHLDSLEVLLRSNGIPVPARPVYHQSLVIAEIKGTA